MTQKPDKTPPNVYLSLLEDAPKHGQHIGAVLSKASQSRIAMAFSAGTSVALLALLPTYLIMGWYDSVSALAIGSVFCSTSFLLLYKYNAPRVAILRTVLLVGWIVVVWDVWYTGGFASWTIWWCSYMILFSVFGLSAKEGIFWYLCTLLTYGMMFLFRFDPQVRSHFFRLDNYLISFIGYMSLFLFVCSAYWREQQRVFTAMAEAYQQAQKGKEEAERLSQVKQQFLANMSHEVRTPMNGILGMLQLLQDRTDIPSDIAEDLDVIRNSADSMVRILSDFLDLSRLQEGKMPIHLTDLDTAALERATHDVMALFRASANSKKLGLLYHNHLDQAYLVTTDLLRYKQIITNLLANAIKFTEAGEVSITLNFNPTTNTLQCTVRDTGIGMSAQQLEQIFQPFVQVDSSATRKFGGTGLGLTISRALAEQMSGTLSVQSTQQQGSVFTLALPASMHSIPPDPNGSQPSL